MNWWKNLKGKVRTDEFLSKHTTFKIGGPAKLFIEPKDINDLKLLITAAKRYKISLLVIGAGSNILASDNGVNCIVLRLSSPYFKKISVRNNYLIAGAGSLLSSVVSQAQDRGLSGVEFLAGIPGTIGGALSMNAGAWGKNIGDLLEGATVMDYNGKIRNLNKKDIKFGYRQSSLVKYIILSVCLKGIKKNKSVIQNRLKQYLYKRRINQDLSKPSAGCVFKNPSGVSAGRLIDLCGLKGKKIGGACISRKHANFIINQRNAKADDVLKLMELTKRKVKNKFNIILKPEIKIWQ